MSFLRQLARIFGGFFIFLSILFLLLEIIFLVTGRIGQPLGLSWYQISAGSLTLTQTIIQRYIFPSLWDFAFVPLLKMPSWKSLTALVILTFVAGTLLNRVPSRKKSFGRAHRR